MTSLMDDLPPSSMTSRSSPRAMPAVGRSAVLQGFQKEAEFCPGLLVGDVQGVENRFLDFLAMDTDAAPADFIAVQHDVIGAGPDVLRAAPSEGADPLPAAR